MYLCVREKNNNETANGKQWNNVSEVVKKKTTTFNPEFYTQLNFYLKIHITLPISLYRPSFGSGIYHMPAAWRILSCSAGLLTGNFLLFFFLF